MKETGPSWAIAKRRAWIATLVIVGAALVFVAGFLAGHRLKDVRIKDSLAAFVHSHTQDTWSDGGTLKLRWAPLPIPGGSLLHNFEYVKFRLAPFHTYGRGGAIKQVGEAIIFASPTGELGYLSGSNQLHALPIQVQMNFDRLRNSALARDSRFLLWDFRVLGLLAVATGNNAYDLYVSHARYGDGCFEVVVSKIPLIIPKPGEISLASTKWQDLFVTTPCVKPNASAKKPETLWNGSSTGGRLVLLNDHTILLSVGDMCLDGVNSTMIVAQDPKSTLGKIVSIDLRTGASEIYASGVRNPQGLMIARDGVIWETEHGPQGGDEINILKKGGNYGWPYVTYGTQYGGDQRTDWPLNPVQGRHDGYDKPAFAFIPSIGISNLIQPDPREFPLWKDHLMVGSMRAASLFLVRIEDGSRPVYAEQLHVDTIGRVRDLISLSDGRIAVLNDEGELALLRNVEHPPSSVAGRQQDLVVTLGSGLAQEMRSQTAISPAERGRTLFASHCSSCHAVDGTSQIAPHLDDLMGRTVGNVPGFSYSPALKNHGGKWSPALLHSFLPDPQTNFSGSRMPPVSIGPDETDAIIAYLGTLRSH